MRCGWNVNQEKRYGWWGTTHHLGVDHFLTQALEVERSLLWEDYETEPLANSMLAKGAFATARSIRNPAKPVQPLSAVKLHAIALPDGGDCTSRHSEDVFTPQ